MYPASFLDKDIGQVEESGDDDPFAGAWGNAGASGHGSDDAAEDPFSVFYGTEGEAEIDARIGEIDHELNNPYPSAGTGGIDKEKLVGSALDAAGKIASSLADTVARHEEAERKAELERERLALERQRLELLQQGGRETPYGIGYRWGMGGRKQGESFSPAGDADRRQFEAGLSDGLKARQTPQPQNTGIVPPHLTTPAPQDQTPVEQHTQPAARSVSDDVRAAVARQKR